jgi:hypothetical protein
MFLKSFKTEKILIKMIIISMKKINQKILMRVIRNQQTFHRMNKHPKAQAQTYISKPFKTLSLRSNSTCRIILTQ